MKRLILALGLSAGALAISTPASAQTGCRWYDVNCRIATGDVRRTDGTIGTIGRVDSSWRLIGRDANGNEIYERRRVDGNGNVIVERARRDSLGRMVIIDRDVVNNRNTRSTRTVNTSRRYEKNGMICTYKENSQGYKEQCKYAKNSAGRLYRINDVNRNGAIRNGVYRGDDDWDDDRGSRVKGDKYKTANANSVYRTSVNAGKPKGNSGKYHGEANGRGKGKGRGRD